MDIWRPIWICCWWCLAPRGTFMLVDTGVHVFYQAFQNGYPVAMLSGARNGDKILPFFVTTQLGPGPTGLVIAAVLAVAMSSMSSVMNSISAVTAHFDFYLTGMVGHVLAFGVGFAGAVLLPFQPRLLANPTRWTKDSTAQN